MNSVSHGLFSHTYISVRIGPCLQLHPAAKTGCRSNSSISCSLETSSPTISSRRSRAAWGFSRHSPWTERSIGESVRVRVSEEGRRVRVRGRTRISVCVFVPFQHLTALFNATLESVTLTRTASPDLISPFESLLYRKVPRTKSHPRSICAFPKGGAETRTLAPESGLAEIRRGSQAGALNSATSSANSSEASMATCFRASWSGKRIRSCPSAHATATSVTPM